MGATTGYFRESRKGKTTVRTLIVDLIAAGDQFNYIGGEFVPGGG